MGKQNMTFGRAKIFNANDTNKRMTRINLLPFPFTDDQPAATTRSLPSRFAR